MNKETKKNYLKKCINKEQGENWLDKYELVLDIIIDIAIKEVSDDIIKIVKKIQKDRRGHKCKRILAHLEA